MKSLMNIECYNNGIEHFELNNRSLDDKFKITDANILLKKHYKHNNNKSMIIEQVVINNINILRTI